MESQGWSGMDTIPWEDVIEFYNRLLHEFHIIQIFFTRKLSFHERDLLYEYLPMCVIIENGKFKLELKNLITRDM